MMQNRLNPNKKSVIVSVQMALSLINIYSETYLWENFASGLRTPHTPTQYVWLTVTHIHTLHIHTSQFVSLPGSGHALTSFGRLPFTQCVLTALRLNKHQHTHASDLWSSKFLLDNEKWESHTQICRLKLKKKHLISIRNICTSPLM